MFDVGLPELLVIVIVALVVVGPKDLPKVVRGFARTIARMRRMVDEFMGTVNDYVRESELQELREAVEKTRKAMKGQGNFDDLLDPVGVKDPVVVNDPKVAPSQVADEAAAALSGAGAEPPNDEVLPSPELTPAKPSPVEPASVDSDIKPAPAAPKPEGQGAP